jgi:hypothetical protein
VEAPRAPNSKLPRNVVVLSNARMGEPPGADASLLARLGEGRAAIMPAIEADCHAFIQVKRFQIFTKKSEVACGPPRGRAEVGRSWRNLTK